MSALLLVPGDERRGDAADRVTPKRPVAEPLLCFARGTTIATPEGPCPVEDLAAGDLVTTRDNGARPVRWIGRQIVEARGSSAPVVIAAGALGNDRDLVVGQRQTMLVSGWRAELMFGEPEVLAAAGDLVDGQAIRVVEGGEVAYFHVIFDRHEIVGANGAPSGSFHPGDHGVGWMAEETRAAFDAALPGLRTGRGGFGPLARMTLTGDEARALRR